MPIPTLPANVEALVFVTARLVTVVVPNCDKPETAREVEVAFVAVKEVKMPEVAWKIEAKSDVEVELVKVPLVALKSEVKKEVVVAFVPVAFTKVKF